jgi:hypothetical protein
MLQVFYMDVVKVDRDVAYVASVLEACCKCFRGILQVCIQNISFVSDVNCKCFDLNIVYISHICCKSMFQMFQLFHSYVAIIVFMLQVVSVLSRCCICFTNMLQVYVPNVSSTLYCIQVFSCCMCFMLQR